MEALARASGAALVGVTALPSSGTPIDASFTRAVVAAIPLSRGVLATCRSEPTKVYAYHYRAINAVLDRLACVVAGALESRGWRTFAVPASQIADWEGVTGGVSHIHLAVGAGLGFRGRHNLLVTPRFGAGVRLVSVLTDAPLPADAPAGGDCGPCRACIAACPAAAVGEAAADWRRGDCLACLTDFKRRITNQYICGVCVRVCAEAAQKSI